MSRIYDDPDHNHYGPIRRLHVMLMQLTADVSYRGFDVHYGRTFEEFWDDTLSDNLKSMGEAEAIRKVLSDALWVVEQLT